jgi:hypothetical protein
VADAKFYNLIGQSGVPFILSAFANQDRTLFFKNKDNAFHPSQVDAFIKNINTRLNICKENGISNWKIAIDLELNKFSKSFAFNVYENLDSVVKLSIDNNLISDFNILSVMRDLKNKDRKNNKELGKDIDYHLDIISQLTSKGVNILRFEDFNKFYPTENVKSIRKHLNKIKNYGDKLEILNNKIYKPREIYTSYYLETDAKDKQEQEIQELDLSKVKKEIDPLTQFLKKLEKEEDI